MTIMGHCHQEVAGMSRVNYLQEGRIEEDEWLALVRLSKQRGFEYLRGRNQDDGRVRFLSGMTQDQLHALLAELRIGGWTRLPTTRKCHFFRKRCDIFDNPSLCKKHNLWFHTYLDHDDEDSDKCVICLKKARKLGIIKVFSAQREEEGQAEEEEEEPD